MGNPRRRVREVALQILCAVDATPSITAEQAVKLYEDNFAGSEESEALPTTESFDREVVTGLVRGVLAARPDLDRQLGEISRTWRVERMAMVDRNILRLGLHELRLGGDTPARVAINEAVELAKRFGSSDSPPFVNAILDSAMRATS